MTKDTLKNLFITLILLGVVFYLAVAFITATFNPKGMPIIAKAFAVLGWLGLSAIINVSSNDDINP